MSHDDSAFVGENTGVLSGTVRSEVDWDEVSPSTAVIETTAAATGREPEELEPLHGWVDPDGMDTLFRGSPADRSDLFVSFTYLGYDVTVAATGVVTVDPPDR